MAQFELVMLPTEQASKLYIHNGEARVGRYATREHLFYAKNQHLYLVDTKATIEIGDWYCSSQYKGGFKVVDYTELSVPKPQSDVDFPDYKILYTTDISLGLPIITEETIISFANKADPSVAVQISNIQVSFQLEKKKELTKELKQILDICKSIGIDQVTFERGKIDETFVADNSTGDSVTFYRNKGYVTSPNFSDGYVYEDWTMAIW